MTLILASGSTTRRVMLDAADVVFDVMPAAVDEAPLRGRLRGLAAPSSEIARELAALKAQAVCAAHPDALVIGSDSLCDVAERAFDKPTSRDEAKAQLRIMSGATMRLTSAVVLARGGDVVWAHVEVAELDVRSLSDAFIAAYLDAEWPAIAGCVGAFRIEGRGVQLFDAVRGSHFTILGMPLLPLLGALRERGVLPA